MIKNSQRRKEKRAAAKWLLSLIGEDWGIRVLPHDADAPRPVHANTNKRFEAVISRSEWQKVILAEESGMLQECRTLAAEHVDMMFHVLCQLGYGVGLDAAARGMGIAGKPEGMSGAVAPALWAEGRREEVLRYVAQDVRATLELARACETCGSFRWVARSGKVRTMALPEGWLPVDRAEQLPEPDTSWMESPWSRTMFTGWLR